MPKIALGPQALVYPMPALLVGADVDGRPVPEAGGCSREGPEHRPEHRPEPRVTGGPAHWPPAAGSVLPPS